MPVIRPRTLPNVLTLARVLLAPAIFFLALVPTTSARLLAFALFLLAALSDVWDGYLARKHGWITNFGKLVDPIADKLLLAATFIPLYLLSHRPNHGGPLPFWGALPLWILLLVFGREALITALRGLAAHRGIVIPAGRAGKHKALSQNVFIGSALLWYALQTAARTERWSGGLWDAWRRFHGAVVALALLAALGLTLYSMAVYLWKWRALRREATG